MSHRNWASLPVGWIPRSGIAGPMGIKFYNFASIVKLPFIKFETIYTHTNKTPVATQSHPQNVLLIFKFLNKSDWGKMLSQYYFNLIISYFMSSCTSFLYF